MSLNKALSRINSIGELKHLKEQMLVQRNSLATPP